MPFVSALTIYPIKSCAGVSLEVAQVGPRGMRGDRAFMLVDPSGRFITQREQPRMALITPTLKEDGNLVVKAPGMPEITIVASETGKRCEVMIWRHTCIALDQGDASARWFSAFLGAPCRLVSMPQDYTRRVNP